MPGKDIATQPTATIVPMGLLDQLESAIKDPSAHFDLPEVSGSPAEDILRADSLDELNMLVDSETLSMSDVDGKQVRVLGFKVLLSDFEGEGLPFYLLCSSEIDGELGLVRVGGTTPVAYLVRRARLGKLPMDADEALVFSRATDKTKAGFYPWNVKRVKAEQPF
jgi:hypothetical protein